ncbi:MAG: relaxase/mobilization nuclease domain-containing protein [Agriterribacter sp.]
MVTIIKAGRSIRSILNYNENKLKDGRAVMTHSMNFGKDSLLLSFNDKINTFYKLISLNERTKLNAIHISLNFDPADNLTQQKLSGIASSYMDRIGFSDQPYLVYQHFDSGHPHIHIVSTNIRHDGTRIALHNIGKTASESARKQIEKDYKLIKAESKNNIQAQKQIYNLTKAVYGHSKTKNAIAVVLENIINTYLFTSLPELNAILNQYNIKAERGNENSRTFKHKGLLYSITDEQNNKISTPLKASLFVFKPTLPHLENKFAENKIKRAPFRKKICNAIDYMMLISSPTSLDEFSKQLKKENIQVVIRKGKERAIYGLTFIDAQNKCVFNGSDLGKQYSAAAILQRCGQISSQQSGVRQTATAKGKNNFDVAEQLERPESNPGNLIEQLFEGTRETGVPSELKYDQTKRRKKRRLR